MHPGANSLFRALGAFVVTALLTSAVRAETPTPKKSSTPQERKRQQLLDELGLQRVEPPTPTPAAVAPMPERPEEPSASMPAGKAAHESTIPTALAPSFRRAVHPLLVQSCQVCHRIGGPAGATHLLLNGDVATDYGVVRALVTPTDPPASMLLVKASGQVHGGGAPWPASGEAHARVLAWIAKGARLDGAPSPAAMAAPLTQVASPSATRRVPATPVASQGLPVADQPAPQVEAPPDEVAPAVVSKAVVSPGDVHAVLMQACSVCHNPRGPAAATRLVLSGDLTTDLSTARALLDPLSPPRGLLVTKATGERHGGGVVLASGDPRLATLLAWAEETAPATAVTAVRATATAPAAQPTTTAPAPPPSAPHGAPGLPLPAGFMLNGRFDLAYERRQFSGNPFEDSATNALRSYHHFLFLSRESTTSPIGVSIEILSLQFWEVHARLGGGARPWRLVVGAGKILVPFGADPLMHQSYGGLAGFDQRILPTIWAQEGAAAHLTVGTGRLLLTDDAFAVHGYTLTRADAIINLQSDFSAADDARIGFGNRLGVSWLNASAWYSTYFNPLGFGRRLFMQAVDVTIWRPRGVPVLGHFSAGAGLLRADVSGGGAGLDYYDFGSYFQLRYHPTDWLYVQYRQGLRTVDNRRGVIVDNTRLTPDDMSTHNFAVVGRWGGLSATLAYFLMFEKAGEIPNDFLRASVAYDF